MISKQVKKMTILKGVVDGFNYFSIDFQLFYFLARIIPGSTFVLKAITMLCFLSLLEINDLMHFRIQKHFFAFPHFNISTIDTIFNRYQKVYPLQVILLLFIIIIIFAVSFKFFQFSFVYIVLFFFYVLFILKLLVIFLCIG